MHKMTHKIYGLHYQSFSEINEVYFKQIDMSLTFLCFGHHNSLDVFFLHGLAGLCMELMVSLLMCLMGHIEWISVRCQSLVVPCVCLPIFSVTVAYGVIFGNFLNISFFLREHALLIFNIITIKKVGSARLRESGIHPISPKTPGPQYQHIDRKKRKEKKWKTIVGIEQLRPIKKHWPCS